MEVSNCCGEKGNVRFYETEWLYSEAGMCPKCGEHCEYIEEKKPELMNNIIIGCNYHTNWQTHKAMRFVLVEVSGNMARLKTRNTGKDFWTNIDDLVFINSDHNKRKAQQLLNTINTENEQDKDNKLREVL